jgi:uncharacterized protein YdhG (YjbR/CyaY superfamily)
MAKKPTTIDEWLAERPADLRAALERLRRTIRAAAPDATECISYGLPAFKEGRRPGRKDGRMLVGFGAGAGHGSFYVMSTATLPAHARELAGFETSKGTVRFTPDRPIPATLVKKLVKARLAENAKLAEKAKLAETRGPRERARTRPALGSVRKR